MKLCVECGQPVEEARECYALPTCFACLPPPDELPWRWSGAAAAEPAEPAPPPRNILIDYRSGEPAAKVYEEAAPGAYRPICEIPVSPAEAALPEQNLLPVLQAAARSLRITCGEVPVSLFFRFFARRTDEPGNIAGSSIVGD
jgi:hypothetical protein